MTIARIWTASTADRAARRVMSVIVRKASLAYEGQMSLRSLFAMLIAISMLFAPLGIQSGSAIAMAPAAEHHDQTMGSGHCGEKPATESDGKAIDKTCCVAMCTAIAVAPVAILEPSTLTSSTERPSLTQIDHSFLAELPTPPPRFA